MTYSRSKELSAEAFMQGDEAGEEGSGSGRSYPEDYDSEGSGDDGSGDHEGRKYLVIQVKLFGNFFIVTTTYLFYLFHADRSC